MQATISTIDPVTLELHVEVPWDRIAKGMETEYGKLQKNARIKGFRQGKAPRNVVVQLYKNDVKNEVTSNVVNESVIEAVQKHELPVVSTPMLTTRPTVVDGAPMTFTVRVEVRPKIESLDAKVEVTRRTKAVTEGDVDAELERIRKTHAVVQPVDPPRPAQKGDLLSIDYTIEVEGEKRSDMTGDDRPVELGNGQLLPELDAALAGMSAGETKTVAITRPEDDGNKDLAGKTVIFTVTLKSLRERRLPDLDDEFAKDVGAAYTTFAELKQKTRERLEESAKANAERKLKDDAIEALAAKNPIPVPPSLVDQQVRAMAQEYLQFMQMMGQQPQFTQAMLDDIKPRAEGKVRAGLLLGEIARLEKLTVSPEELEARFKDIAQRTGKHIAKVRVEYQGEKREQLESSLLEEKIVTSLLAKATITDGPFEAAKEGA